MFRRNCLTVKYCSQQSYAFGQVKCFCKFSLGAEVKNIAFVYPLESCAVYNPASTHITAVKRDDGILRAIDIRDICRNCIYIEIVGEDHTDLCNMFHTINIKDIPDGMQCLLENQREVAATKKQKKL